MSSVARSLRPKSRRIMHIADAPAALARGIAQRDGLRFIETTRQDDDQQER